MKILILLIYLFTSFLTFSKDEKINDSKEMMNKDKLVFTKEEFKKAVYDELKKKMRKIGRSRLFEFAKELLKKEDKLMKKEVNLKGKEEQIAISGETLKKRVVEFNLTQKKFITCLDKKDQNSKKRIDHMVSVISGMRPQTASNLLSSQDPDVAVEILGMLDATKVSKIFNVMDKEISSKLQKQYLTLKK